MIGQEPLGSWPFTESLPIRNKNEREVQPMLDDTTLRLRMEILQVLADHPGSTCSRSARAIVYGWTDEQMQSEFGVTMTTVHARRYKTQLFIDGGLPLDADSYCKSISDYYRDALNFTDLLSDAALIYIRMMLLELHRVRPDRIKFTPLNRLEHMKLCG